MTDYLMMIFLAILTFVAVGVLSHAELGRTFNAGWVTASASMTVMVLALYGATYLWHISVSLRKLVDLLTEQDGTARHELHGTLQRFWQIAREVGR